MKPPARRRGRAKATDPAARHSPGITFQRLLVIALVVAAVLPVATIGLLAFRPIQEGVDADATARTERARSTAQAVLQRRDRDLDDLAQSYAEWPTLADMLMNGNLESIRTDVLGFLVGQGSIDDGLIVTSAGTISAGRPDQASDLLASLQLDGSTASSYVALADGLYAARSRPIQASGAAAAGSQSEALGQLVFLRRLDARFATDVVHLTGFDVTILAPSGAPILFTDEATAHDSAILGVTEATSRSGSTAAGVVPLELPDGQVYRLLLTADLGTLNLANGELPTLLAIVVIVTTAAALFMALILASILRRRLGFIHDSLAAIADGRVPPAGDVAGQDELSRVGVGLGRLVEALDRREMILRRSLAVAASLPTDRPVTELAERAAAATVEIFGLRACRVVDGTGEVLGSAEGASVAAQGSGIEAPLGIDRHGDGSLVGTVRAGAGWTDGDQVQFEVMALLVGTLIRDAELYGRALDRAERVSQVNRLQREFLRAVSHGLQTPLTTIGLATDDLVEGTEEDPFLRTRAEIVRSETRRLVRQVAKILTLSRLDAGMVSVEPDAISPARVAQLVWADLGGSRQLEVDDAGHQLVIADSAALEQILGILLDNANRYAASARVRVRIGPADAAEQSAVAQADEQALARIVVEDEGPGVAPAERERIFRRFVRGSTSTGSEGMGLGLGVARGLARAMGGDLRYVQGELGGAAFALTLPAALHEHGTADQPAPHSEAPGVRVAS
jgi:signal transduction histidine kinase